MKPEEFAAWWVIVRDILFVLSGIALLTFDITAGGEERKWTWVVAGGLVALPVFAHRDERSPPTSEPPAERVEA